MSGQVKTVQAGQDLLRLDGIGVRLGGRDILRDVSFTARAGEFIGLIGPNGAGKTTLLKVILGLRAPTAGRVLLNGGPRPRRGGGRLIGYVPQKLSIDPDMPLRARDVVALGVDGHRLGLPLPSVARRELVAPGRELGWLLTTASRDAKSTVTKWQTSISDPSPTRMPHSCAFFAHEWVLTFT